MALSSSPHYHVFESTQLSDLFDHLSDDQTLVVFDLDSTLMRPAQQVGSEHWEEYLASKWTHEGMCELQASRRAQDCWLTVQQKTKMLPVEPAAPAIVHRLQQQGHQVMGLTARSAHLAFRTHDQLASMGIHLLPCEFLDVPLRLNLAPCVGYQSGILFAGYESKGKVLTHFFYLATSFPQKVVFIDDKKTHIYEVGLWMQERCVDYVGMLYRAVDPAHIDPDLAAVQWRFMHEILPDEAAALLLKHGFLGPPEL